MALSISNIIIIILVILFALYLIYSQKRHPLPQIQYIEKPCETCNLNYPIQPHSPTNQQIPRPEPKHNIEDYKPIANPKTSFADNIKKQDMYMMNDPLTYPQLRLPREVLKKYEEYYEKHGSYPPFNQNTRSDMFDTPILTGILIKQVDENDPFTDNIPNSVPIFKVKSIKNINRFFYYIIDQRYLSKIEPKIPLDHIKVNGVRFNNADFYGIPELYDGDIIENIPIYPNSKFKVVLYKTYHFP